MRFRFVLDGTAYSKHKEAFKTILRRHELAYKGTRDTFVWSSRQESVTALFDRDEARGVTNRATLIWQSRKKTPLFGELREWVWAVGGKSEEDTAATADAKAMEAVERELAFWDAIHKPDAERLRTVGRPASWIERDLREWKRKRAERKRELLGRLRSD